MAKKSNGSTETTEDTVEETATVAGETATAERSNPITLAPNEGGNNVAAAWRGLVNLFGAQVERWDITDGGLVAVNFTVDGDYDPAEIVDGISGRERRLEFLPFYNYYTGTTPTPFTSSLEMTKWMQSMFRKPGEEGKSPDFVKRAIAAYKKANEFPARKGRPKKVIRIDELSNIDPTLLQGVNVVELERLKDKIASAIAAQSA